MKNELFILFGFHVIIIIIIIREMKVYIWPVGNIYVYKFIILYEYAQQFFSFIPDTIKNF